MYVLGIDVGTQSVRVMVCDSDGKIIAQSSESFSKISSDQLPAGWFEQDPADWWNASVRCISHTIVSLAEKQIPPNMLKALAVDSTSGTVVAVDLNGDILYPALMYNDSRAEEEAAECNNAGSALTKKLGYKFASSFALPKILWIKKHKPEIFSKTDCLIHAADYIVGKLTGNFRVSDTSNALKTGYDLVDHRWPDFIESSLDIPLGKLPDVFNPGQQIGSISKECSRITGLNINTPVIAGVTDGTAGFFASGAVKVGDWNTTIGTTLVIRGVSKDLINDPLGRIYCHAHPQRYWLPGGASNVGAECISKLFAGKDLDEFNRKSADFTPSPVVVFPLVRQGERLPFINHDAEGFVIGTPQNEYELYAAYLQGVGFVERWCYELMKELGTKVGNSIYATGGGAKSETWTRIRADILNKQILKPESTECVVGTAVVAASGSIFPDLETAAASMIKINERIEPDPRRIALYDDLYNQFREECTKRGYI